MVRQRSNKFVLASAVGAVVGLGTTAFGQCVFFSNAECDLVDSVWGPYNNQDGSVTKDPNSLIDTATPVLVDQNGNLLAISQGQTVKVNGVLGRWPSSAASGTAAAGGVDSDTDWY
ncbi:MAG: hypothetical protein EBQ99_09050, partial [Planctomycetes bacterium]|nr:hypothetical protein [Planctomycetota bacterium]